MTLLQLGPGEFEGAGPLNDGVQILLAQLSIEASRLLNWRTPREVSPSRYLISSSSSVKLAQVDYFYGK